MYAACPACKSVYPISAEQLRAAGGRVRCGNCNTVFDATGALFDEPQQAMAYVEQHLHAVSQEIDDLVGRALDEVPATAQPPSSAHDPEALSEVREQGETDQPVSIPQERETVDLVDVAMVSVSAGVCGAVETYAAPVAAEFAPAAAVQEQPDKEAIPAALLFDAGTHDAQISWGAIAAALFLIFLLLGQYVWSERYRLAAVPAFRPYLETACAVLGCDLPLRHETAKLEVLEREIRNHPHVDDALLVNATFVNGADFVQRYPIFEVTFSDVSGTPVAMRRFMPGEYLGKVDASTGMAPGQRVRLLLEIVDPGDRAVSFQFDFL
jgi:predicted Zn finger-like uncharacterized protein